MVANSRHVWVLFRYSPARLQTLTLTLSIINPNKPIKQKPLLRLGLGFVIWRGNNGKVPMFVFYESPAFIVYIINVESANLYLRYYVYLDIVN